MSESKAVNQGKFKEISRRELLKLALCPDSIVSRDTPESSMKGPFSGGPRPLGKLTLDISQCTGCGVCITICPSGALTVSASGESGYQLLFRSANCTACNLCVEDCPEKCLHLERIAEPDKVDSPVVLFEDKVALCPECGSPIAPRAMVNRIRTRIIATGQSSRRLELCPACKVKFSSTYPEKNKE
jgi:formate hydrogenlyase subunit 6/NADH:ubiquinone oxidoreductase subunit I